MRVRPYWIRCGVPVQVVGVFLLLLAGRATGQQLAAGVVGQVTDENGGVLPGVTVTATSPALQVPSVTDITDQRGEYRLDAASDRHRTPSSMRFRDFRRCGMKACDWRSACRRSWTRSSRWVR